MSIRREPTYLSTDTWQALFVISRAFEITPDELANDLLDKAIKERFPSVLNYLGQVDKLRKEVIKTIGGTNDSHPDK